MWSLSFAIINKDEKQSPSESVISVMVSIAEKVNNQKTFLPKVSPTFKTKFYFESFDLNANKTHFKTPNHSDLGLVYECSYRDVQPFNFRVQSPNGTGFSTFKKLLKDVSMS